MACSTSSAKQAHFLELSSACGGGGVVEDLGEQPRPAEGVAGEHHGGRAALEQGEGRGAAVHVAGRDHGHGQLRRQRERDGMIGAAAVELSGACADGCRRRLRRRRRGGAPSRRPASSPSRSPERILTVTGTSALDGSHHRGDDRGGAVGVAEQRRAGAGLETLRTGQAMLRSTRSAPPATQRRRRVGEHLRVGAEELKAEGVLARRRRPGSRACAGCRSARRRPRSSRVKTRPAPQRRTLRRKGGVVMPAIGAMKTRRSRLSCPMQHAARSGSPPGNVGLSSVRPAAGGASRSRCRAA